MTHRTEEQDKADSFDRDLYALIGKADMLSDKEPWRSIYWKLKEARPLVRKMMHPDDRRETA